MPDIFDQLAPDQTAGATGDIFDQITAKPAATTTPVADTPKLPLAPMPNVPMKTALTPAEFWRRGMEFADKGQRNLQQLVGGLANAGNFTGEGAIIEPPALSEKLQKQRIEGAKQALQAGPILPVSELAPNPGFVHGALKVAEGLTTPQNLFLVAATQGTAEAALALKGWPLAAVRALNLSLGGYFTYHFGKDAGAQVSDAWKAFQAHDYERVAEDLGAGTVDGLMAAFGIHHGLKSGNELLKTPVPNLPETRTDLWSIGHSGSFARSTPEVMPDLGAPEAPLATVPKPPVTIDVQPETVPPGDGTAPPAPAPAPVSPATFAERQAAALAWARQNPDARISQIQRQFGLGYGTAAKIMRQLETGRAPGAAVPAAPEPPPSPAPAPEPPNSTPEITVTPAPPPVDAEDAPYAQKTGPNSLETNKEQFPVQKLSEETKAEEQAKTEEGKLSEITVTPAPPPVDAEDAPYAQKTGPNSLETNKEQFPVQKLSEETKGEEQAKTEEGKLSEVAPPSAPTSSAGDVFDAVAPAAANAGDVFDAVAPEEKATSQEGAKPEVATEGEATPPAQPSGFTTSKGSTYTVAGNGTKRLKKVTGEEFAASDRTVYVTPDVNQRLLETLQALGADSSVRAAIRTVGGNQLAIVVKDRKTGDVRNDLSKTFAYTEKPALGLHPVEVWNKNPETGEYGYHLGHAITKIDRAAKPSEVATEPEATPPAQPAVSEWSTTETKPLAERSTEDIEAELAQLQKQDMERTERYETDDKYYGSPEDRKASRAFTDQTEPLKAELSKRKAAADAAHNRELQRKQDRDRLERALTIRPQNPTVKDVDAQHSKDIPATYSLADYRGGNRLLKATGQASIVQTFDTQEWQWANEYTGPAVKARERFAEYAQKPLTQADLDQETKYIRGEWSERHGLKPAAETKDDAEQKPEKHPVPEINRNPQKQFLESIPSTDPNVRVYEVNRWPNGKIQVRSYNSALGSSYGTNFDTLEQAREQVAAWNKQNDERKAVSAQSGAQKAPKQSGAQQAINELKDQIATPEKAPAEETKPEITLSPAAQESERLHRENVAERHRAQEAEEQEQTFRTEYQRLLAKARKEAELDYDEDAIRATQKKLLLQGDDKHASAQVGERHAVIERKTEKVGHGKKATTKTVFAARLYSDRGQPREFTFDNAEQAANWATENLYGMHGANGYGGGGHFVSNLLRTGSLLDNTNRGYAAAEAAANAIGHPELRQAIYQGAYFGGAYGAPLEETLAEVRRKHSEHLPANDGALTDKTANEKQQRLLGTAQPARGYSDWENQLEDYERTAKGLLRNLESVRERFETARIVNGGTHPEIEKREQTFNEYEANIRRNLEYVREQTKQELEKHRTELEPKVKAAAEAYAKYGDAAAGELASKSRANGRTGEMDKARYAKLAGLGDNVSWPKLLEHFGIEEQAKPEPIAIPTGKDKLLKEEREALPTLSLDGESYIASPGARARFQKRGWADNEGKLTELGKRAVYTIRTNDNEALNGKPMSEYQPGKGTLASPGESWFGSASNFWAPVKGEVWHTNSHGAWAGDFPANWPKRDESQPGPDISKVIPEKKGQTLKPIGFNAIRRGPTDAEVQRQVYFSNGAAMSAEYFDYTNKRYGQVTWTQEAGKDSNPLQAWLDGKRVAIVMPLRGEGAIPENLKGLLKTPKVDIAESRPVLPEGTEGRPKNTIRDTLGGGAPYSPTAPLSHKIAESRADLNKEPGHPPTVFVNRQAFSVLHHAVSEAFGLKVDEPGAGDAVTMNPAAVRELRKSLLKWLRDPQHEAAKRQIEHILSQIDHATADENGHAGARGLILVNARTGMSAEEIQDLVDEERAHHLTLDIHGSFVDLLDQPRLVANTTGQIANAALQARGYPEKHVPAEIIARLIMRDKWQELGLKSRAQAGELAVLVTRLLKEHNGEAANEVIRAIAKNYPEAKTPITYRDSGRAGRRSDSIDSTSAIRPQDTEPDLANARRQPANQPAPPASDEVERNPGERGSLSIDPPVVQKLRELFHGKDGEPRRDYSALGAAKSKVLRNLSQLEEASEPAHAALVRAASWKAQSAALIRAAWPKVVKALGKDTTDAEFRAGLIESRLQGTEQRWRDLSHATAAVPKDELVDWVLNGPMQLLATMSEDGDLAQQAAALAENISLLPASKLNKNAHQRLSDLVAGAFEEAAASVHHMMAPDAFDELTKRPGFEAALDVYHREIEPELAENHSLNEGVFSDALGPLDTYYPLVPIRAEDQARAVTGARRGFKKPANIANSFATGLADDYDASMEAFAERVGAALRVNDKAAAIQELVNAGMLRKLKPGESAQTVNFRGQEYRAHVVSMGPARTIVEGSKVVRLPEERGAIPEPFYHELKPILEPNAKLPAGIVSKILHKLSEITLSGPADMIFHSHNLLGALVANTPFLGDDLASKTIGNTPFTKVFTAIGKLVTVDPMDDAAVRDLQQMAKLGLLPERFGQETYSKRYAEMTGAKRKHWYFGQFSPVLYGPKGVDVRARLIMYRLAQEIAPDAGPLEIYKFVNQLGNYTEALQGHLERALKSTGLSPFYTAGSTMIRNGIDAWLGTGSGSGPGGGAKNRLAQQLSAGALGVIAAWILTYKLMTGKYPWEDKLAKFLKIPAADWMRKSKVGMALWGKDTRKVGYLNFGFSSPLVSRGSRALGVQGGVDTALAGGNAAQIAQAAKRDVVNSAIHPVAGPPVRVGLMGITGKEAYLVSDRNGGNTLLSGLPKKAPIGSEALYAARELNSFYGNVGAAAGFQGPHDEGGTFLDRLLRAVIEMSGITSPAQNPYAQRKALADERRRHH